MRAAKGLLVAALATSSVATLNACGSGEGRPDEELGDLVRAPNKTPAPVAVDRATKDVAELQRALSLDHGQVTALIGPHTVTGHSHSEVLEKGARVEVLDDDTGIELDGKGNFHAVANNTREYGREIYFVEGWLYLRPRFGKFHRRRPNDEREPVQMRSEIFGTAAATLELLGPGTAVSDGGATTAAGRPARLVKLTTAGSPSRAPPQPLVQRKWRETAVVKEVAGSIALDAKTGVPLRVDLRGTVAFQRGGRSFEMRLEARHELGAFGAVEDVNPPPADQVLGDIEQRHEIDERDKLLEGIAPPAERTRTPSSPPK